jgi:hypothetical protein
MLYVTHVYDARPPLLQLRRVKKAFAHAATGMGNPNGANGRTQKCQQTLITMEEAFLRRNNKMSKNGGMPRNSG